MNKFHKRLRTLRVEKGLTQQELGKLLNLSRTAVGDWETTSKEPNIDNLMKLADIFNVTLDELCGRDNSSFLD